MDYFSNFDRKTYSGNTKSFFSSTANLFQKADQHKFEFHFEGPKYLLDLDQDCFIYPVNTPINVRGAVITGNVFLDKTYYLHLNPAYKILSIYTENFKTGGEYIPPSD
ncbi:MAG: hypothetical protein U9532_02515 ['Conium maculatum' witches'-broom phytoplasma]|nr:hypothetical protein ['Conium maculatum' witches'-broom phytoplasma]